jgi:hypothetical protein
MEDLEWGDPPRSSPLRRPSSSTTACSFLAPIHRDTSGHTASDPRSLPHAPQRCGPKPLPSITAVGVHDGWAETHRGSAHGWASTHRGAARGCVAWVGIGVGIGASWGRRRVRCGRGGAARSAGLRGVGGRAGRHRQRRLDDHQALCGDSGQPLPRYEPCWHHESPSHALMAPRIPFTARDGATNPHRAP